MKNYIYAYIIKKDFKIYDTNDTKCYKARKYGVCVCHFRIFKMTLNDTNDTKPMKRGENRCKNNSICKKQDKRQAQYLQIKKGT